jgi:hypothetical protein
MGRNEGRSQNSGGIGLLPLHSNTPSIYNLGPLHIRVKYQQIVIMHGEYLESKSVHFQIGESNTIRF